ncbi:hypothetical protein TNCV_237901 [Trichonephila clavipes]|nr:hypothetical protein TNCV_237901 [Trichonephila clavipes]
MVICDRGSRKIIIVTVPWRIHYVEEIMRFKSVEAHSPNVDALWKLGELRCPPLLIDVQDYVVLQFDDMDVCNV